MRKKKLIRYISVEVWTLLLVGILGNLAVSFAFETETHTYVLRDGQSLWIDPTEPQRVFYNKAGSRSQVQIRNNWGWNYIDADNPRRIDGQVLREGLRYHPGMRCITVLRYDRNTVVLQFDPGGC